jgi:hypothetical protein
MKTLKTLLILLLFAGTAVAQSNEQNDTTINPIHLGSYTGPSPLYIIEHQGKKYVLDTLAVKELQSETIEAINVTKNTADLLTYGEAGKYGVISVKLKETAYPKAFSRLKKYLTPFKNEQ